MNSIITKYTKAKTPYFFLYAKGKKKKQVEDKSECVVDRISSLLPKKNLTFNFNQENIGKFDYRVLMHNPNIVIDEKVIDNYKKITRKLNFNNVRDDSLYNYYGIYEEAKRNILNFTYSAQDIIDMIIIALFVNSHNSKKTAFWTLFGDEIYENVVRNVQDNFIQCNFCQKRFYADNLNKRYCSESCKNKAQKIKKKIKNHRQYLEHKKMN